LYYEFAVGGSVFLIMRGLCDVWHWHRMPARYVLCLQRHATSPQPNVHITRQRSPVAAAKGNVRTRGADVAKTAATVSLVAEQAGDEDVLIEFRNVCKAFGDKTILNGASFKIRRGEAVGIIGASGERGPR
jgi:ABC-type multidrug transport system fused ATPase/permease subunit